MKDRILNTLLVLVLATLPAPAMIEQTSVPDEDFKSSPVMFIENGGQWDDGARFQVWGGPAGTMWLADNAIWITVLEPGEVSAQVDSPSDLGPGWFSENHEDPALRRGVNIKLSFVGANPQPRISTFDRLDTVVSYFLGNDPEQWRPDVPVWGGVRYADLYPGIDLEVTSEDGQMVPRLAARSGADLAAVQLRVEGADAVAVDGDLLRLSTAVGELDFPLLRAEGLQVVGSPIEPSGVQAFDVVAPFVPANANRQSAIKDREFPADNPADLLYGTFLGGSSYDDSSAIAVDRTGSVYVVGGTLSGNFPTTPGAFDTSHNSGGGDAFVTKLNPTGSALVYATFLGGGGSDGGHAITVDGAGSTYVTGNTGSGNFPTTPGAFDTSHNGGGDDAFVTKLNPTGSALAYSTFLGGSSYDVSYGIAIDGTGSTYVSGGTISGNFPTTPGALSRTFGGGVCGTPPNTFPCPDAFVARLNLAGSALIYATFLGGSSYDDSIAIALDGSGRAYVTGCTESTNFPTTPGAFDTSHNGISDAFVAKLNPAGSALVYGTFLGGTGPDCGRAVTVVGTGSAYVTGGTHSSNFPTTQGVFDTSHNGSSDTFVAQMNPAGNALTYATFLGGSSYDYGNTITLDGAGYAYVAGRTDSSDFPGTPGAFDTSRNGSQDAFMAKLNPAGSALAYATFLGGSTEDSGRAIAVDRTGSVYVTGDTLSANFPTTPGAFATSHNGGRDAFAVKLAQVPNVCLYLPSVLIELPGSQWLVSVDGHAPASSVAKDEGIRLR